MSSLLFFFALPFILIFLIGFVGPIIINLIIYGISEAASPKPKTPMKNHNRMAQNNAGNLKTSRNAKNPVAGNNYVRGKTPPTNNTPEEASEAYVSADNL